MPTDPYEAIRKTYIGPEEQIEAQSEWMSDFDEEAKKDHKLVEDFFSGNTQGVRDLKHALDNIPKQLSQAKWRSFSPPHLIMMNAAKIMDDKELYERWTNRPWFEEREIQQIAATKPKQAEGIRRAQAFVANNTLRTFGHIALAVPALTVGGIKGVGTMTERLLRGEPVAAAVGPMDFMASMLGGMAHDVGEIGRLGPEVIQQRPLETATLASGLKVATLGAKAGLKGTKQALAEGEGVLSALKKGRGYAKEAERAERSSGFVSKAKESLERTAEEMIPSKAYMPSALTEAAPGVFGTKSGIIDVPKRLREPAIEFTRFIGGKVGRALATPYFGMGTTLKDILKRPEIVSRKRTFEVSDEIMPGIESLSEYQRNLMFKAMTEHVELIPKIHELRAIQIKMNDQIQSMTPAQRRKWVASKEGKKLERLIHEIHDKKPTMIDFTYEGKSMSGPQFLFRKDIGNWIEDFDSGKIGMKIMVDKRAAPGLHSALESMGTEMLGLRQYLSQLAKEGNSVIGNSRTGGRMISDAVFVTNLAKYLPEKYKRGARNISDHEAARLSGIAFDHFKRAKNKYEKSVDQRIKEGAIIGADFHRSLEAAAIEQVHAIERFKLYQNLANRKDIVTKRHVNGKSIDDAVAPGDYSLVPETKIAGTNMHKYGALAGHFVRNDVWATVKRLDQAPGQIRQAFARWTRAFKKMKVIAGPTSHVHAMFGHQLTQVVDGGSPAALIGGFNELKNKGRYYKAFSESGLMQFMARDLGGIKPTNEAIEASIGRFAGLKDFAKALANETHTKGGKSSWTAFGRYVAEGHAAEDISRFFTANERMTTAFVTTDMASRMAIFKRRVDRVAKEVALKEGISLSKATDKVLKNKGLTDDAAKYTNNLMIDYDDLPHAVQFLRSYGIVPFIAYPYRIANLVLDMQTTHPVQASLMQHMWAPYYAGFSEEERRAYETQPLYERGLAVPIPGTEGKQMMSFRFMDPFPGASALPEMAGLAPGTYAGELSEVGVNRFTPGGWVRIISEQLFGKDIEYDADFEGLGGRMSHLLRSFGPGYLYRVIQLREASRAGTTLRGQKLTPEEVIGRVFGIRTMPTEPGKLRYQISGALNRHKRDLERQYRLDIVGLTPEDRAERLKELNREARDVDNLAAFLTGHKITGVR